MKDHLAAEAESHGDDEEIRAILLEICAATQMGFAAVARVTEQRWIACQVLDRIDFGLDPGGELKIQETICNEIRQCGCAIVIADVTAHPDWRRHPVPILYGFRSYASFPIYLADGEFYGTLCAIDPEPRNLSAPETIMMFERCAGRVASILSRKRAGNGKVGT